MVQEGPLMGGLRVTAIMDDPADELGTIELRPDNSMTGLLVWQVIKEELPRFNIGDRIIMEAPSKWFTKDTP